ncbi:hypothetical protein DLAC_10628 [Tieghemostelium lacteum]|uniref:Uncharacterized protein n=1 Tax=Tieghemostelium lacteum TaxID=361077 RepID=A0A151Z4F6_TIELA|nr:hypothetical protein DLAC_10628 [Tieghemostelium lacteum]|eukprot:KYQ88828.1 hypothetical protein DLAC_10628 [Tieghemostelium lacteum]
MKIVTLLVFYLSIQQVLSIDHPNNVFGLNAPMFSDMNRQWGMITFGKLPTETFTLGDSCTIKREPKNPTSGKESFGFTHMVGFVDDNTCYADDNLFDGLFDPWKIFVRPAPIPIPLSKATSQPKEPVKSKSPTPVEAAPSAPLFRRATPSYINAETLSLVDSYILSQIDSELPSPNNRGKRSGGPLDEELPPAKSTKSRDTIFGKELKFSVQSYYGHKQVYARTLYLHSEIQLINAIAHSDGGIAKLTDVYQPLYLFSYHFPCFYCTDTLTHLNRDMNSYIYYTYQWDKDYVHWQNQEKFFRKNWIMVPTPPDPILADKDYKDPLIPHFDTKRTKFGHYPISFSDNLKDFLCHEERGFLKRDGFVNCNYNVDYFLSKIIPVVMSKAIDERKLMDNHYEWDVYMEKTLKIDKYTRTIIRSALAYVQLMNCARAKTQPPPKEPEQVDYKIYHLTATPLEYLPPNHYQAPPQCQQGYTGSFCEKLAGIDINVQLDYKFQFQQPSWNKHCLKSKFPGNEHLKHQRDYFKTLSDHHKGLFVDDESSSAPK